MFLSPLSLALKIKVAIDQSQRNKWTKKLHKGLQIKECLWNTKPIVTPVMTVKLKTEEKTGPSNRWNSSRQKEKMVQNW